MSRTEAAFMMVVNDMDGMLTGEIRRCIIRGVVYQCPKPYPNGEEFTLVDDTFKLAEEVYPFVSFDRMELSPKFIRYLMKGEELSRLEGHLLKLGWNE